MKQRDRFFSFTTKILLVIFLSSALFTACKKDDPVKPEKPKPTIDKIEIGSNNNGIGVIGRDFHFNAEVAAGDKIENVQVKIQQRAGETYAKAWSHEITWTQYRDAKNATIHKHFDIPADAAEGKYDFIIVVTDQNGTLLEEKKTISLYLPGNLPVDPKPTFFVLSAQEPVVRTIYNMRNGFTDGDNKIYKNEKIIASATISGVKDDGKMYLVLINKKHNHRPESINAIDFSKAIVWDVWEHKNKATVGGFANVVMDNTQTPPALRMPMLTIGAEYDNNVPTPNAITGVKAWEPGVYYVGVVYYNSTHNMSAFHYVEVEVVL